MPCGDPECPELQVGLLLAPHDVLECHAHKRRFDAVKGNFAVRLDMDILNSLPQSLFDFFVCSSHTKVTIFMSVNIFHTKYLFTALYVIQQ